MREYARGSRELPASAGRLNLVHNLVHRVDDDLIDTLAVQGIAYVPYFPLGGFSPLQSGELGSVAALLSII